MTNQRRVQLLLISIVLLLLIPLGNSVLYTVDERELAVILQFGNPVQSRTEPGLYFKLPVIQQVMRLPKTLQVWHGSRPNDQLVDVPTKDGKKIEVTVWAAWRINDPVLFVQTLRTELNAESRVKEFVRSHARDTLTSNNLSEVVRSNNRKLTYTLGLPEPTGVKKGPAEKAADNALIEQMVPPEAKVPVLLGRTKIVEQIMKDTKAALNEDGQKDSKGRGIELVDVGLTRIEFVPQVRDAAFRRATALMESIAIKSISEGEQRKQEIINRTQAEVQKIQGEGAQESSSLRGKVDAEVIEAYAKAIQETGDFYNFLRVLEAYKKSLAKNTRLILTTDNEMFRMLKQMDPGKPKPPGR
ncbi:MAG: protease modulator HflC [Planctomycetes bacterium]|nr:protease modulator HflC [Planctomycetota bacterium]